MDGDSVHWHGFPAHSLPSRHRLKLFLLEATDGNVLFNGFLANLETPQLWYISLLNFGKYSLPDNIIQQLGHYIRDIHEVN